MPVSTICLVMIVRNESHVIKRCLDSVREWIDHWIICDTGSTDHTRKIIKSYFRKYKIPGELLEHEWVDFGYNRTLAVSAATGKADYLLLMDADFTLVVNDPVFKEKLLDGESDIMGEVDGYMIKYEGENATRQMLLIKGGLDWKYMGVTHEYIHSDELKREADFDGISFVHHADGGCRADKYTRDVELLLRGLEMEPDNCRYYFYLGQSYRFLEKWDEALATYQKRSEMSGYDEEIYYSLYQVGYCKLMRGLKEIERIGGLKEAEIRTAKEDLIWKCVGDFMKAYEYRPDRLEALYELVKFCRENQLYKLGYDVGKVALDRIEQNGKLSVKEIPMLAQQRGGSGTDRLFVSRSIHDWLFWDELAICGYYADELQESMDIWMKVLKEKCFEEGKLGHIKSNLSFALKGLAEQKKQAVLREKQQQDVDVGRGTDQYILVKGYDSPNGDIRQASTMDIEHLINLANKESEVIAFNSNGWLKRSLTPNFKDWVYYSDFIGTYVRRTHIDSVTGLRAFLDPASVKSVEKEKNVGFQPDEKDINEELVLKVKSKYGVDLRDPKREKRICIYCPDYTSIGGSELTIKHLYQTLVTRLDRMGSNIQLKITTNQMELVNFNPKLVITQQLCTGVTLEMAKIFKYDVAILLHGPNQFRNDPCVKLLIYNSEQLLRSEEQYIAPRIARIVLHPTIDISRVKSNNSSGDNENKREYITFIGSNSYNYIKGSDLFVTLAKMCPDQKFLHVSRWSPVDYKNQKYFGVPITPLEGVDSTMVVQTRAEIDKMQNLEVIEQTTDMAAIYAKTKVLIVPSLFESYGRVAVEACINGIPVVGSNLPGIREATYEGGVYIDQIRNVSDFADGLRRVLDEYSGFQEKCLGVESKYLADQEKSIGALMDELKLA
jgi:glycosyltransferase involved in cell wall biosynthesis